ncbi:MAG: universal stress protein [Acidobacteriota bacterium]
MTKITKVLLPTDFSECAQRALTHAVYAARLLGAELHMLHAIELHANDPYNPAYHFPESDELGARLTQIATREMAGLVAAHVAEPLVVHQVRKRGIAAGPVILDYAEAHETDLIVLGTNGRRGLPRWLLGSVTEEVMRSAKCPVLTVRATTPAPTEVPIRDVLVAIDFARCSEEALSYGKELAKSFDARLHLLHVVEAQHWSGYLSPVTDTTPPNAEKLRNLAELKLRRIIDEQPASDVEWVAHARFGYTKSEILSLASELEAGYVVVGSQGFNALEDMFFGSTAEAMVRRASCPVLVVEAPWLHDSL